MPEFSGYDVLNTLKKDKNFDMKKIVVITASNLDSMAAEKIELLGIGKLVRKPIALDALEKIFSEFT